jgi:hypothetical protein
MENLFQKQLQFSDHKKINEEKFIKTLMFATKLRACRALKFNLKFGQ